MSDQATRLQLVTFELGIERYGIDIMQVKSIEETKAVRPIPERSIVRRGYL